MEEDQIRLAEELLFSGKKQPSFAKQFYFGVFDGSKVFPYPTVSKEDETRTAVLIDKLTKFADATLDPDWIDRHANIPDAVIDGLGKLGILGITVPKEFGGLGMPQYTYCKAEEFLASRCASTALFVNAHQSIGVKSLVLFGTPEQQARWLPSLAKGEQIAAFSLTEPNAGSDAGGIETRAVFDAERNVYRLTGKKQWTTSGAIASVLTVMALTEVDTPEGKRDKVTAFLVTPDMPGFHVTAAALEKVGYRGTKTANLEFRDMEVPASNILGPLGGGLRVCLTALDFGRVTFGSTCTGAAKVLLEKAVYRAKTRYQFKRPLSSFTLVKQKLVNIAALTYAMDATTYMTAGLIDAKVDDMMLESAMLKVFASDSLWTILYDTMQIFGGRCFFTEEPLERMMRDARLNMIGEGSNEVLRAFIGAVGMRDVGMELKEAVDALKSPWSSTSTIGRLSAQWIRRWGSAGVPVQSKLLTAEAAALGKAIRRFGRAVVRALARYRQDVVEKQLVLDRIATSAMAIYTTTAVLSKLDSDLARVQGDAEALGDDVAIGKFYCNQAMEIVDRCLGQLFSEVDDEVDALSDKITGGRKG